MGAYAMALGWRMGDAMGSAETARTTRRRNTGSGFTLMEVLAVSAIIALLIGLLVPCMGRARDMARRAKCMANLRAMGSAMPMYASDNGTYVPRNYWPHWKDPSYAPGQANDGSEAWGRCLFAAAFAQYLGGPDLSSVDPIPMSDAATGTVCPFNSIGVFQCTARHNPDYPLNYVSNGVDYDNYRATGGYADPNASNPYPKGSPASKLGSIPGPLSEVAY
jgi:prepilin-type N-terminal cleavage/methylation domain-containing protein